MCGSSEEGVSFGEPRSIQAATPFPGILMQSHGNPRQFGVYRQMLGMQSSPKRLEFLDPLDVRFHDSDVVHWC